MGTNTYRNLNKPKWLLIPIIFMMGFIPIIVHTYSYNANLSQFDWWSESSDSQTDFFFGWKMVAIIVTGVVMALLLLYRHFVKKERMKFENSFYLLFFYLLFVGMSALFSSYKYWVVHGTYELFEPVWVTLVYGLACYYVYHVVHEEAQVKLVLGVAAIGMAIVTLIGVFQHFGLDFFKSNLGKHLITNIEWWENLDAISFNLGETTSYTTLYNPNFLSFYFGMLVALLAGLFIGARKWWKRLLLAVAAVLCIICLHGSGSSAGWMALTIAAVLLALLLMSRRKKLFYAGLGVMVLGIVAAIVLVCTTTVGQSLWNTIAGTFHFNETYALQGVTTGTDDVKLNIRGNELSLSYATDENGTMSIVCLDADGNELTTTVTDDATQTSVLADERYAEVYLQLEVLGDNYPGICVTVQERSWNFAYTGDAWYYLNLAGNFVDYDSAEHISFFREDAMSGRGYIWNNTLPLLVKHILMGSGANTYMLEYPQDDYLRAYMYGDAYDVKAHCWYLQQWVETGLIGTLALLGFLLWYVIYSVRIYRRADWHDSFYWTGFALFAAVLVYLLAAISNDSNVCTAPIFWCMLGLGFAVNRALVQKEGLFVREIASAEMASTETIETAAPKKQPKKQSRKQRKQQGRQK